MARVAPVAWVVSFALLPAVASADTIAVTAGVAEGTVLDPDSSCSLREAVHTANGDANFGDCTQAGSPSGPDTITIPAGTYTLTGAAIDNLNVSGDVDIDQFGIEDEGGDLTIIGAGDGTNPVVDTVIDANNLDRAFDVHLDPGDAVDVGVEDLRVLNGNATDGDGMTSSDEDDGGGVRMRDTAGRIAVRRVTIEDSDAARWGGAVSFHNSTSGSSPGLQIIDSELIGNGAASGGAVWTGNGGFSSSGSDASAAIGGATRIVRSTFTQNTATHKGGAIYLVGPPEGSSTSGLSLLNSTIDGNSAGSSVTTTGGGGAIAIGAGQSRLYVHFSTITGNSSADAATAGGIQADNTESSQRVYFHAAILAANTATGSATDVNCLRLIAGSPVLFDPRITDYNVESANTCGLTEPGGGGTDNFDESATLLGALGENGGETQTREPVTVSPVLNLVPSASCFDFDKPTTVLVTDDQRGLPRPFPGGPCDAGAVELQSAPATNPPTVTPTPGPVTTAPAPAPGTKKKCKKGRKLKKGKCVKKRKKKK